MCTQRAVPPTSTWPPLGRTWLTLLYLVPLALIGALIVIYWISPSFYLRHVLSSENRERQAVELVTFSSAAIGFALLAYTAVRLWRQQPRSRGGSFLIAVIALATLFFAGEEISWGQQFFGWQTPDVLLDQSPETNLHNLDFPVRVQTLGSVFLIITFGVLPLRWWRGRASRHPLPAQFAPAIAEGPVIWCMAVAFGWRFFKAIYRGLINHDWSTSAYYDGFVEQVPEQKEMLLGVGLLMYGVLRIRWIGHGVAATDRAKP